ncbi:hypothetical protein EDD76_106207 [Kineothrix alysoides]|uniref:Uncharacterized protein n=1 Tax=Kineothrix alysoides TaxID=1469948 RepID=A0A4R1QZW3_9FIRM|nr:hypothetical protein [Kineothrix alysoides]TCL58554.1 hypothetical protein EDD76_106207 [Kineothrix alysoides]
MKQFNKLSDKEILSTYVEHNNSNSSQRKGSTKVFLILGILLGLSVTAITVFCLLHKTEDDLIGTWVREPDDTDYAGMKVEIRNNNNGIYEGVIVYSPSTDFPEGEVKWINIKKESASRFSFYDLGIYWKIDFNTMQRNTTNHKRASVMNLSLNGEEMSINVVQQMADGTGRNQHWRKEK